MLRMCVSMLESAEKERRRERNIEQESENCLCDVFNMIRD